MNENENIQNLENNSSLRLVSDTPKPRRRLRPPRILHEEPEKTTADYNQCLSAAKVAKLLDVHPLTVHRMLKDGRLQGIKNGRLIRVFQWSFDEYLIANTAVSEEQASEPNKPKRPVKSTSHHVAMRRLEELGL